MELFRFEFIVIRWIDLIDIFIMTLIIYETREVFRRILSTQVIILGILLFITWKLVDFLGLRMLKTFLDGLVGLGSLAIVIIFAPEIRKVLINFSSRSWFSSILRLQNKDEMNTLDYHAVIEAVFEMASTKTGASIVIKGSHELLEIEKSGEALDANLTKRLLVSIFSKNSPLHDGAVLIRGNKITAVRCILPISESITLPPELGLRHRSALGLSEISDALIIVVSEERGTVTVVYQSKMMSNLTENELLDVLVSYSKQKTVPFEPAKVVKPRLRRI
jgi:uncharacterized protein (TIGR00159 family)